MLKAPLLSKAPSMNTSTPKERDSYPSQHGQPGDAEEGVRPRGRKNPYLGNDWGTYSLRQRRNLPAFCVIWYPLWLCCFRCCIGASTCECFCRRSRNSVNQCCGSVRRGCLSLFLVTARGLEKFLFGSAIVASLIMLVYIILITLSVVLNVYAYALESLDGTQIAAGAIYLVFTAVCGCITVVLLGQSSASHCLAGANAL